MQHRPAQVDVGNLLERLKIDAVKKGNNWVARCPFHEEKTPSWRMRDEAGDEKHGKHVCYGCGEGGSHVYLVMRMLGIETAREAWLWVNGTDKASARALDTTVSVRVLDPVMPTRFRLPPGVEVGKRLEHWPHEAKQFAERRGLTGYSVQRWGIGYAYEGRLRNRLVIPVHDATGLRSYTARTWLKGDPKELRKYLEPHEREHADKAAVFGEQHWRGEFDVPLVVTEGALNALAVERATNGQLKVAALLGSHFDREHALKLVQFKTIVVASDPDKAGKKMRDAIDGVRRWATVVHARTPNGIDACDVAERSGYGVLARIVTKALPPDAHRVEVVEQAEDLEQPEHEHRDDDPDQDLLHGRLHGDVRGDEPEDDPDDREHDDDGEQGHRDL